MYTTTPNRLTRLVLLAACTPVLAGVLAGCDSDTHRADLQVEAQVQQGHAAALSDPDASLKSLGEAAGLTGASTASRAQAKGALAQAELDAAVAMLNQVQDKQLAISRLSWEIGQQGSQIQTINLLKERYQKYDPSPVIAEIDKKIAEAKGAEGKGAWFEHDGAPLPTLSAVTQEISRLEGQITKIQDNIKTLQGQRTAAIEQAEQAGQQAANQKGDEAVATFTKSSESRKQAADLATQVEIEQASLIPLQRDLAIAQSRQEILNRVVAQYQAQQKQIAEAWAQTQKQIEAQTEQAGKILEGRPEKDTAPQPIAEKASQLAKLVEEVDALRETAQQQLNNAETHFEDAINACGELLRDFQQPMQEARAKGQDVTAMQTLLAVYHPAVFKLQKANVYNVKGSLHSSAATTMASRTHAAQTLTPILEKAGLKLPSQLQDPDLENRLAGERAAADKAFEDANKLLLDVLEAPGVTDKQKQAARIARILVLYNAAQAATAAGNANLASTHMETAIAERDQLINEQVALPTLPSELAPPPSKLAPPAPATQTEPAA